MRNWCLLGINRLSLNLKPPGLIRFNVENESIEIYGDLQGYLQMLSADQRGRHTRGPMQKHLDEPQACTCAHVIGILPIFEGYYTNSHNIHPWDEP